MPILLLLVAGATAFALSLALHPGPVALATASLALGLALLPTGRRLVAALAFFTLLGIVGPAWAGAPAAVADPLPWLTPLFDQGAAWLIGIALSGIGALLYRFGRVAIPAVVESRLKGRAGVYAHLAIVEMEREALHAWTPERRRVAVGTVVSALMDHMPWAVAHLGLTQTMVSGFALEALNHALGSGDPAPASPLAGLAGTAIEAALSAAPHAAVDAVEGAPHAAPACPTCGASDAERVSRGCTALGCPQVAAEDGLVPGLAAAAGAAFAVPGLLLDAGLSPTG